MPDGGALTWRELVEKHHSALLDELSAHMVSELQTAVARAVAAERSEANANLARACDDARRTRTESLNQALRRLRQASSEEQTLRLLAGSCAPFAGRSVVVVFENNQAKAAAIQGYEKELMPFDIVSAPAVLAAIESRDPVTALATPDELSPELAELLAGDVSPDCDAPVETIVDRAYLFPITERHSVVAMLIASGQPLSAPIELLCEAAGMRLETFHPVTTPKSPALVQLTAASPEPPGNPPANVNKRPWEDLSPDDQRLHLQAQRTARLRVAEMRLYHEEDLRNGFASGDIYAALRAPIDAARTHFLQTYLSKSPSMVDYLHLEILRSLARDDDRLLGQSYPGPMV
jgi:hypothetical protein